MTRRSPTWWLANLTSKPSISFAKRITFVLVRARSGKWTSSTRSHLTSSMQSRCSTTPFTSLMILAWSKKTMRMRRKRKIIRRPLPQERSKRRKGSSSLVCLKLKSSVSDFRYPTAPDRIRVPLVVIGGSARSITKARLKMTQMAASLI